MAHQFHFLEKTTLEFFRAGDFKKGYYNVSGEELQEIADSGDL